MALAGPWWEKPYLSSPINAGTAEPFRVSPPEAVAYPLELGTCVACEATHVRVATATAECACQVCEHCAEMFMADGACGVCGAALSADNVEEEDD
jgi:hypothetical protein